MKKRFVQKGIVLLVFLAMLVVPFSFRAAAQTVIQYRYENLEQTQGEFRKELQIGEYTIVKCTAFITEGDETPVFSYRWQLQDDETKEWADIQLGGNFVGVKGDTLGCMSRFEDLGVSYTVRCRIGIYPNVPAEDISQDVQDEQPVTYTEPVTLVLRDVYTPIVDAIETEYSAYNYDWTELTVNAVSETTGTLIYEWYIQDGDVRITDTMQGFLNADTKSLAVDNTRGAGKYYCVVTNRINGRYFSARSQTITLKVTEHVCKFTHKWTYNNEGHWHWCTNGCNKQKNYGEHEYGEWVILTQATGGRNGEREKTCSVCGKTVREVTVHIHTYGTEWFYNEKTHWNECTDGDGVKAYRDEHKYGEWEIVKQATDSADGMKTRVCGVCGYEDFEVIPIISLESVVSVSEVSTTAGETGGMMTWIIVGAAVLVAAAVAVTFFSSKRKLPDNVVFKE